MKKMYLSKPFGNKKCKAAILATLVLVLAVSMIASISAVSGLALSEAFLSVRPNPVGLNQELLINAWTSPQPPLESPTSFNGRPRHNYTFVFTKPNGDKLNVGPLDTFGEGTVWFTIRPDQLGLWSLTFNWPGDEIFQAATKTVQFTVQTAPIPGWPAAQLPTGYWEYPINTDNREWSAISGNWLMTSYNNSNSWQMSGGFNPYTTAPSSSHILWERTTGQGGIIGGEYGSLGGSSGSFSPPIIMDGYLYYGVPTGFVCVDLRNGALVYNASGSINIAVPQSGGNAELRSIGGTSYTRYNAYTGNLISTLTGATAGYLNWACWDGVRMWAAVKESYIFCWNSSKVVGNNWASGVVWNSTTGVRTGGHLRMDGNVIVVAGTAEGPATGGAATITTISVGFDCNTGRELWRKERPWVLATECCVGYGKLYQASISTGQLKAFDLQTGDEVWSKDMPRPWGVFATYSPTCAYGNLYWSTYDGNLWCLNPNTGATVWNFSSGNAGLETPYSAWPFWQGPTVADGKVYASTSEHSPTPPHIRGCRFYCVDAITGKMIWSVSGSMAGISAANGYVLGCNELDAKIYAFAKGKTETAVTAAPDVVTKGSSVIIKGTVMDLSPAQPNTPAISEQDMDAWMDYVHMQKPLPTGTSTYPYYATGTPTTFSGTGVTVQLTAVSPSGSTIVLGNATSDASGFYSFMWQPPAEGKYTIVANFAGSNSYYQSYAETAVGVSAAPAASVTPSTSVTPTPVITNSPSASPTLPPEAGQTTMWIIVVVAVIVIAAVVAAVIMLKRRK